MGTFCFSPCPHNRLPVRDQRSKRARGGIATGDEKWVDDDAVRIWAPRRMRWWYCLDAPSDTGPSVIPVLLSCGGKNSSRLVSVRQATVELCIAKCNTYAYRPQQVFSAENPADPAMP